MTRIGTPDVRTPWVDGALAATGPVSPAVVVALAVQPVLTAALATIQGALHAVDWVAPPGTETIELAVGVLLLLVSILAYGYTVVLVVAYGYDILAGGVRHRLAYLLAAIATVAQATFLVLPVYRVYGPATFEEVLFTVDYLAPLAVAALATLCYLALRTGRLERLGRADG